MAVDFNLLAPIAPKQQFIQTPSNSGGGIGDLLQGLAGLTTGLGQLNQQQNRIKDSVTRGVNTGFADTRTPETYGSQLTGNLGQLPSPTVAFKDPNEALQATMFGIAQGETGGSKNPYASISIKSKNGDRAYGKYQIMGNNIPAWSREALGYPVTIEQFIANPEIQEKVAAHHINKHLAAGYSPEDTASIWFSGRPLKKAGNAKDAYGTTVPVYVDRFRKHVAKFKPLAMNNSGQPDELFNRGTGGLFPEKQYVPKDPNDMGPNYDPSDLRTRGQPGSGVDLQGQFAMNQPSMFSRLLG